MIPPQPPHPPKAQQGSKRKTWALIALILSAVSGVLGLCTAASPLALFILGGGGDTEGFEEFARIPMILGIVILGLSAMLLVIGAILFAVRDD